MRLAVFVFLVVSSISQSSPATKECSSQDLFPILHDSNPIAVKTLEEQWLLAYANRDKTRLDCILADDFEIGSIPDDKFELHGKQHVLQWVATRTGSAELEHLEITSYATAVVARGIYSVRRNAKMISRFQFTDFFIRRDNRWQAVSRTLAQLPVR